MRGSARRWAPAAVFAVALAVRLGWVVHWDRVAFDGHDRLLLRAFEGRPPDPSPAAHPGAVLLWGALGRLVHDPRALVVVPAVAGSLAAALVAVAAGRRFGALAGAWAGLLVALLAEHAAWSTSPYPVVLAQLALSAAFAVRSRPAAGALALLAGWLRPETAVPALLLGLPGLGGLAGALAWRAGAGAALAPADPLLALPANLAVLRFLGPPVLLLALAGLGRRTAALLGGVAAVHLAGAAFDDYGARHALSGGVLLCVLGGVAAARRPWLGALLALGLYLDTAAVARAWYAHDPPPAAGLPRAAAPPAGCLVVSDEPPIAGQEAPSHLLLFAGRLDVACAAWGEEFWHRQWSSRGLRDRARKVRTLWRLRPVSVQEGPARRTWYLLEPRLPWARWRPSRPAGAGAE